MRVERAVAILALLTLSVLVLTLGCERARTDDNVEGLTVAITELTSAIEEARVDARALESRLAALEAELTDVPEEVRINTDSLESLLEALEEAVDSLRAATEPKDGNDWEAVRENATTQMVDFVRAFAECRSNGWSNRERVTDYLEQATWRDIAMGEPIGNPSAIVDLMDLYHCSTTALPGS